MSSARDSNWSPQPPNLQELEKNEAAAMPVMFTALVHSPGGEGGGGGPGAGVVKNKVSGPGDRNGAERGAAEQTPGGQTGQRRTQLGGRRGGGRRRRRGGWWHTSRPAYLLVSLTAEWYQKSV